MENIVIKIDVWILYIITKSKTKIAIKPVFILAKMLEFRGKRGIMAITRCFCEILTLDNANRVRGNALAAAGKAEFFFCCCFYVNVFKRRAKSLSDVFAHFFNVWRKLGLLRYYRGIDIGNRISV